MITAALPFNLPNTEMLKHVIFVTSEFGLTALTLGLLIKWIWPKLAGKSDKQNCPISTAPLRAFDSSSLDGSVAAANYRGDDAERETVQIRKDVQYVNTARDVSQIGIDVHCINTAQEIGQIRKDVQCIRTYLDSERHALVKDTYAQYINAAREIGQIREDVQCIKAYVDSERHALVKDVENQTKRIAMLEGEGYGLQKDIADLEKQIAERDQELTLAEEDVCKLKRYKAVCIELAPDTAEPLQELVDQFGSFEFAVVQIANEYAQFSELMGRAGLKVTLVAEPVDGLMLEWIHRRREEIVQLLERQVSGAPEIAEGFSDHLVVGDRLRSEILSRAFARAIDARWHRTLVALQRVYHLSSITDLGAVSEAHSKAVAELSRLEQEANNVLRKMGFVPLTINFLEPVSEQVRLFADLCDEAPVARYYPLARLGKEQVVLNVRRWPFLDEAGHLRRRGELVVSRSE